MVPEVEMSFELSTVMPVAFGAAPGPPPTTTLFALSAADDASALAAEKYGMPPLVPEGVRVRVPLAVTGDPEIVKMLLALDKPTLETEPLGSVHVFAAVQSFSTFDVVLKYCSPSVQVDGSDASLRAGMVWPAFVKSTTAEGLATTPPELTCARSV
jgi:hypothetical protein